MLRPYRVSRGRVQVRLPYILLKYIIMVNMMYYNCLRTTNANLQSEARYITYSGYQGSELYSLKYVFVHSLFPH